MTAEQFKATFPKFVVWVNDTFKSHNGEARIVKSLPFPRLPGYFSHRLLNVAKVVYVDQLPKLPLSDWGLTEFAEIENNDFNGITFLDTFFIKKQFAGDEALHFHELIHVIQWRLLGPERFLAAYVPSFLELGYRNCFVETMAYDAQGRFETTNEPFDAESIVLEPVS